jgi:hypothetical protein
VLARRQRRSVQLLGRPAQQLLVPGVLDYLARGDERDHVEQPLGLSVLAEDRVDLEPGTFVPERWGDLGGEDHDPGTRRDGPDATDRFLEEHVGQPWIEQDDVRADPPRGIDGLLPRLGLMHRAEALLSLEG